jgi:site-specific recombinase XerD
MSEDPWLIPFKRELLRQDLSQMTIDGYLADLRHFGQWLAEWHDQSVDFARATDADIRAYRQHLVNTRRQKPVTVNRRLQALRRLYAWAKQHGLITGNPAEGVRWSLPMRCSPANAIPP